MPAHKTWLRSAAVRQRLGGIGVTKFYELIAEEGFPRPIRLGRSSLWDEAEVTQWMEEKAAITRAMLIPPAMKKKTAASKINGAGSHEKS
jgi:prophage regulatory protein